MLDLRAIIPEVIAVPARRLRSPVARAAHRRARHRYRAWPADVARTVDVELRRLQVLLYGSGKRDLRGARRVVELHIIGMRSALGMIHARAPLTTKKARV